MWYLLSFLTLSVAVSLLLPTGFMHPGPSLLSVLLLLLLWTRRIEVGPDSPRAGFPLALLRMLPLLAALHLAPGAGAAEGAGAQRPTLVVVLSAAALVLGLLSRFLAPAGRPITRSAARLSFFLLALMYHLALGPSWEVAFVALLPLLSASLGGGREGTSPRMVGLLEELLILGGVLILYLPIPPLSVSVPLLLPLIYLDLREAPKLAIQDRSALPGLLLSFLTYYAIPFRLWRLHRFYRSFLSPGEMVFDVGSHIGNRVRAFRSVGARVVAVEPQRSCLGILRRFYGGDRDVVIVAVALGPEVKEARLKVSRKNPTMSTLSQEWIGKLQEHYSEQSLRWEREETISVETLDLLIRRYGEPSFLKIDVEGYEPEVLKGLSTPVRSISFEFLPAAQEGALESLQLLSRLGEYRYNYSFGERMRFESPEWLDYEAMRAVLSGMQPRDPSGDVYAVRSGS